MGIKSDGIMKIMRIWKINKIFRLKKGCKFLAFSVSIYICLFWQSP